MEQRRGEVVTPSDEERASVHDASPAKASTSLSVSTHGVTNHTPVSVASKSLGNGRALPNLLFVVNADCMRSKFGDSQTKSVLDLIQNRAHVVDVSGRDAISETIKVAETRNSDGVVLVGGYDLIASQRSDVLPPSIRKSLTASAINTEPDRFVVWSDDAYGDIKRTGVPQLPVTRVPDAGSIDFLFKLLTARDIGCAGGKRFGVRNSQRFYADGVFNLLPGNDLIKVSGPSDCTNIDTSALNGSLSYLMLHGHHNDASKYWGEDNGYVEAINSGLIPNECEGVLLCACCWGSLIIQQPAAHGLGVKLRHWTQPESIALSFLAKGGLAFIGCTGVHYSPGAGQSGMGERMHRLFWQELLKGTSPAHSLFKARMGYLHQIGQSVTKLYDVALELKIYKQFTCLGLGW